MADSSVVEMEFEVVIGQKRSFPSTPDALATNLLTRKGRRKIGLIILNPYQAPTFSNLSVEELSKTLAHESFHLLALSSLMEEKGVLVLTKEEETLCGFLVDMALAQWEVEMGAPEWLIGAYLFFYEGRAPSLRGLLPYFRERGEGT
jgi:hypothetical protein